MPDLYNQTQTAGPDGRTLEYQRQQRENKEAFERSAISREAYKNFFARQTPESLERLKSELMPTLDDATARLVRGKSPAESKFLQRLIYARATRIGRTA